jgi:predicted nucleotidyltransferase/predicted transcriptional regulator
MNLLAEILSSKIRSEIFRMLFGVNGNALHVREIERRSGLSIGTIQQELKKLVRLDLIKKRKDGNRLYYEANREHPLYPDIRNLVLKTIGLVDLFREALKANPNVKLAFVFGSIARHEEKDKSDVDLMIIGEIGMRQLTRLLSGVSGQIGREINPHILNIKEFLKRKTAKDHFLIRVLESPKIFIIGSENELAELA